MKKTVVSILTALSFTTQAMPDLTLGADHKPTESLIEQAPLAPPVVEAPSKFSYAKFNELADIKYPTKVKIKGGLKHVVKNKAGYAALKDKFAGYADLVEVSKATLRYIKRNPEKFSAQGAQLYLTRDGGITPLGPIGEVDKEYDNEAKRFKPFYNVLEDRADRRKNSILSVTYEKIEQDEESQENFKLNLLIFSHSDEKGYIFKRAEVSVKDLKKVSFIGSSEEIPLSDTDFELRVELSTQKAILRDKKHGLVKLMPVTAGALDVRKQIDGVINSMTLLLPGKSGAYKDFNITDSVLIKRRVWNGNVNTASRTVPTYYKGRPFIGIVDKSRVKGYEKNEAGEYVRNGKRLNYWQGYRQIGFHYQIKDTGLVRGFESHGCMRLQDHDLYTLDAILNHGPKDMIPVEIKMLLDQDHDLDSVYKRQESYKKVAYTVKESPKRVKCLNDSTYPVRFFNKTQLSPEVREDEEAIVYHTIADTDCLTQTIPTNESLKVAVEYLTNKSDIAPETLVLTDKEHAPVRQRLSFLTPETLFAFRYNIKHEVDNNTEKFNEPELLADPANIDVLNLGQTDQVSLYRLVKLRKRYHDEYLAKKTAGLLPAQQNLPTFGLTAQNIISRNEFVHIGGFMKSNARAVPAHAKNKYFSYLYFKNCLPKPTAAWAIKQCPQMAKNNSLGPAR